MILRPPGIGPRRNIGLRGGGWSPTYLLRDDFTTAASAPLTSPRSAEPGPGTLTITDTNNKLSVASGLLTFATGGVGAGDPRAWGAILTRLAGRTVVASLLVSSSAAGIEVGWDNDTSTFPLDGLRIVSSSTTARENGSAVDTGSLVTSTQYKFALVMRGTGVLYFIKGGVYTSWTLVWVGITGTHSAYPALSVNSSTAVGTVDLFRVLDLPAPFASDYGLATQRLSGARAAADTFVHEANCLIEFIMTTRPSALAIKLSFRKQDATNYWIVYIDSAGNFALREMIAGVENVRATVATGAIANGHRCVVVADGTTIRFYNNNVLLTTYSSASNFATSTAGAIETLGTGPGAVSDIISWPRTLSAPASTYLDLSVA